MLKELKIADIKVGNRHRKDMGDLVYLAESIRQEGLLQAIGVTDLLELVFGERRIRAVRSGRISRRPSGSPLPKPSNFRSATARNKGPTGNLSNKFHNLSQAARPVTPPPSEPGSATTRLTGKPPRWWRMARPRSFRRMDGAGFQSPPPLFWPTPIPMNRRLSSNWMRRPLSK